MRIVFILLGIGLLAGGTAVLWSPTHQGAFGTGELQLLRLTSGFSGSQPDLEAEAVAAVTRAADSIEEKDRVADRLRRWAGVLKWIGLLASAALVVVAGVFGISRPGSGDPDQLAEALRGEGKKRRRLAVAVGIGAALTSASNTLASELNAEHEELRARVRAAHDVFLDARVNLLEATTESMIVAAIESLRRIDLD